MSSRGAYFFVRATRSIHAPLALVGTPLRRIIRGSVIGTRKVSGMQVTLGDISKLLKLIADLVSFRDASGCALELRISRCRLGDCLRAAYRTFHACTSVESVSVAHRDNFPCLGIQFSGSGVSSVLGGVLSGTLGCAPQNKDVRIHTFTSQRM